MGCGETLYATIGIGVKRIPGAGGETPKAQWPTLFPKLPGAFLFACVAGARKACLPVPKRFRRDCGMAALRVKYVGEARKERVCFRLKAEQTQ